MHDARKSKSGNSAITLTLPFTHSPDESRARTANVREHHAFALHTRTLSRRTALNPTRNCRASLRVPARTARGAKPNSLRVKSVILLTPKDGIRGAFVRRMDDAVMAGVMRDA